MSGDVQLTPEWRAADFASTVLKRAREVARKNGENRGVHNRMTTPPLEGPSVGTKAEGRSHQKPSPSMNEGEAGGGGT